MSTLPKWPPDGGGPQGDRTPKDDRDQTAVLSPPPGEIVSGEAVRPSDAPTLIDVTPDTAPGVEAPDAPTLLDAGPTRPVRQAPREHRVSGSTLAPGTVLGQRYEIVALLGEGGMGAVYEAVDRELNRPVALKVIRPELAKSQAIIERFKQELLLAREVTHRNVIRIYDLGEADSIKFITMEFVQGEDLRSMLLREKKLTPEQAVDVIQQICRALEAAHSTGIIHRDLKPQNVMREKSGRILVMDFGLARTIEGDGMTQTGALVGTMDYMSPEQALAKDLDQRSDLFTVGLIFYELLAGVTPFRADSAIASLLRRTSERAIPVSDHDATIPAALSGIVSKCLERDPSLRYQNASELLRDLDAWQGKTAAATLSFPAVGTWAQGSWRWMGLVLAVVILLGVGIRYREKLFEPKAVTQVAVKPEVSLAILPFRNASGDASLDWLGSSLSDMLSTDVGQSARLRTISPDRLHQVLSDLRVTPGTAIDPTMVGRIAEFSSADTVVWGQYAKFGDQIRVDATLQDLKRDRRVALKIEGASEKDIPGAVDRLAETIRQNLAVSADILKELKASSFQPTSTSVEALRDYNQGVALVRDGKNLEAEKRLEMAVQEDPSFALAFSKLAQTYSSLGYDDRAEQAARKAVDLSDSLPQAEKYVISAIQARVKKDYSRAIAAYAELARAAPENSDVQFALGSLYEDTGDFTKASEHFKKLLDTNPNDVSALLATGRVAIKSGNPQASLDPLGHALSLAIQIDNQEQKALVLQAMGIAYTNLNKPQEALQNYQQSLDIKRRLGQKKGMADSLNMIAETYDGLGKSQLALASYNEALKGYREIGDRRDVGNVLLNLGQFYHDRGKYDDALKLFMESLQIQREVGDENYQALCLNNIGNSHLFKGDFDDARTYFEQALQLREKIKVPSDIADTLHNLGEVSLKMGQYDQALSHYLKALDLRREAADKEGAAKESDSMGTLFSYQGRYGAALKSRQDAMNGFRELQDRSYWMAETLGGYANSLSQVGRYDEADKSLNEALSLARELKNEALTAEIMTWQGENLFYRGDASSAKTLYSQASQIASKTSDRDLQIALKIKLAGMSLPAAPNKKAIADFQLLADQAATMGLKNTSTEASLVAVEALIRAKDYATAQQNLENLLASSEKLGAQPLLAKIHLLRGEVLRLTGKQADATSDYRQTMQIIEGMRKESGDKFTDRADIKAMSAEATRWTASQS